MRKVIILFILISIFLSNIITPALSAQAASELDTSSEEKIANQLNNNVWKLYSDSKIDYEYYVFFGWISNVHLAYYTNDIGEWLSEMSKDTEFGPLSSNYHLAAWSEGVLSQLENLNKAREFLLEINPEKSSEEEKYVIYAAYELYKRIDFSLFQALGEKLTAFEKYLSSKTKEPPYSWCKKGSQYHKNALENGLYNLDYLFLKTGKLMISSDEYYNDLNNYPKTGMKEYDLVDMILDAYQLKSLDLKKNDILLFSEILDWVRNYVKFTGVEGKDYIISQEGNYYIMNRAILKQIIYAFPKAWDNIYTRSTDGIINKEPLELLARASGEASLVEIYKMASSVYGEEIDYIEFQAFATRYAVAHGWNLPVTVLDAKSGKELIVSWHNRSPFSEEEKNRIRNEFFQMEDEVKKTRYKGVKGPFLWVWDKLNSTSLLTSDDIKNKIKEEIKSALPEHEAVIDDFDSLWEDAVKTYKLYNNIKDFNPNRFNAEQAKELLSIVEELTSPKLSPLEQGGLGAIIDIADLTIEAVNNAQILADRNTENTYKSLEFAGKGATYDYSEIIEMNKRDEELIENIRKNMNEAIKEKQKENSKSFFQTIKNIFWSSKD